MAGGNSTQPRQRCAQGWALLSFTGLLWTLGGAAVACAEESSALDVAFAVAADRGPRPGERSIIVPGTGVATLDPDVELATDQSDEPLEPIADVSEYEAESQPDLADPPSAVPDLADPPADDHASIATDEPVIDELPEDESAEHVAEATDKTANRPIAPPGIQTASFNGATPGVTTRAQLLELWGDPLDEDMTATTLSFELKGFPQAVVDFDGETVASIRVELATPIAAEDLTSKLGLSDFRPAKMADEMGSLVSTTYPERGVTYHHSPDLGAMASDAGDIEPTPVDAVSEIVIRPVGAEAFVDRAHSCPERDYAHRLADLETALRLDPKSDDCRFWLSEVKLVIGELADAEELAAAAVASDPTNDEFRLQWAKCLTRLARYDNAVAETRRILEGTTAPDIVRASALEQMAHLAGLGPKEVQERSIPLHNKAIELADKLAADDDVMLQAAAHQVLLDAHLGVAERISLGDWQQKEEFVGQWITRASGIAEQMIAAGEADVSVRIRVAQSALLAGGRLSPPIDPKLWVAEAEQAATELTPTLSDGKALEELHWQLGLAYFHAAEIQHRRGESELSVQYGQEAEELLTPLVAARSEYPDLSYLMGRLHFQIGAVHAVHRNDHKTACKWYDKASKPLLKPTPMTTLATPGHHGDALVSMGVSYWEIGQREKAYNLTKSGLELIEQGVSEGILANDSTLVAQGNLSAMAQALGKFELSTPADEAPAPQVAEGRRPASRSQAARTGGRSQQQPSVARRGAESNVRRR
jgi:tetratricopeptide (TPR) repeat protein